MNSNIYDYSFHNTKKELKLFQGDKLIALSNEDIEFINSNLLRDFFNRSDDKNYDPLNVRFLNTLIILKILIGTNELKNFSQGLCERSITR